MMNEAGILFGFRAWRATADNLKIREATSLDLPQLAIWAEEKWGYLRALRDHQWAGFEKREEILRGLLGHLYCMVAGEMIIGMFAFIPEPHGAELLYVYIREDCRREGLGRQMMSKVLAVAEERGYQAVTLDTLTPDLNKFYCQLGAAYMGEGRFFSCPVDKLRIDLTAQKRAVL